MEPRFQLGLVCTVGVGPTRGGRPSNQDNYLVCRAGTARWRSGNEEQVHAAPDRPELLIAVADGMGGHEDGEIAAEAAVGALSRFYGLSIQGDPEAELRSFVLEAHGRVRQRVREGGDVRMGTTLTAVWIVGDRAYWTHVGDSRLYHWRRGRITQITHDQTREAFAVRDGRAIPTLPGHLAQNFIFGSRGLGDDGAVRIDRGIDTGALSLRPGDRLLLSSDGLHGHLTEAQIADALTQVPAPQACAVTLGERAIAYESDDNITAIVLSVDGTGSARLRDQDTIVPE